MAGTAVGSRTASLVERLFPGGVNSPVRAFRAVGRPPLVLEVAAVIEAARLAFEESAT